jgi:hypothetical protein
MTPAPLRLLYCLAILILVILACLELDENLSSRIVTLAEWHRFEIGCARLDGMVVLDRDLGALLRWSSFGEISRPNLDEDADVLRPRGSPVCICT